MSENPFHTVRIRQCKDHYVRVQASSQQQAITRALQLYDSKTPLTEALIEEHLNIEIVLPKQQESIVTTTVHPVKKVACEHCRALGFDKSGNNKVLYSDDTWWCFRCNKGSLKKEKDPMIYESESKMEFTINDWEALRLMCSRDGKEPYAGYKFRGISDDTYKTYGVLNLVNDPSVGVVEQYYPLTRVVEGIAQICGTKVRKVPKAFYAKGSNKAESTQLFGQTIAEKSGKPSVVVTAGEIDALSVFEMLKGMGSSCPAIVSGTVGEKGTQQYRAQYEFFDKFERIYILPDQDEAGMEALDDAVQALPKDKVYVIEIPKKDANEMLTAGLGAEFAKRYLNAKLYVPDGVLGSGELYDKMLSICDAKTVPVPDFLPGIQEMFPAGFALESIMNLAASSGLGSTSPSKTPLIAGNSQ